MQLAALLIMFSTILPIETLKVTMNRRILQRQSDVAVCSVLVRRRSEDQLCALPLLERHCPATAARLCHKQEMTSAKQSERANEMPTMRQVQNTSMKLHEMASMRKHEAMRKEQRSASKPKQRSGHIRVALRRVFASEKNAKQLRTEAAKANRERRLQNVRKRVNMIRQERAKKKAQREERNQKKNQSKQKNQNRESTRDLDSMSRGISRRKEEPQTRGKGARKGGGSANKIMRECCRQQGVQCMDLCDYGVEADKQLACRTECAEDLKKIFYCGSNGHDNTACCKDNGVTSGRCEPFCDGRQQIPSLQDMFGNLLALAPYLKCFRSTSTIMACHEQNHNERHDYDVRRWQQEKFPPALLPIANNICKKREEEDFRQ